MIDVFEQIKPLLIFENKDDFYYLQILQRKKENKELGSNSRVIKNYYINNLEYIEKRYDEIKRLCDMFNARAMLRLNKRSYSKVAFKTIQNVANSMSNGEFEFIKKSYDRACGNGHNDKNKKWILDIDGDILEYDINEMLSIINEAQPYGEKLIVRLPTKNGIHLIVRPFNVTEFSKKYPNIDIHKDNPINLYIPSEKNITTNNRCLYYDNPLI
jgi:hypothetical protein